MNWRLWITQIDAIARLELKRALLARRWLGIYLVAIAPVVLIFLKSRFAPERFDSLDGLSQSYANVFQLFVLRFGLFISCSVVFSQAFRGDILEKTLHYYLLTPARREVIAVGKYVACLIFVSVLFTISTVSMFFIMYSSSPAFSSFFFEGPGFSHLARYVAATIFGSIAYGAIFLLVGLSFKNPGVPAFALLLWESLSFALPPLLQKFSVVHYLQALLPITVDRGPFAIVTEPTPAVIGIPSLLMGTLILLTVSGWLVRGTQVTYSSD